MKMSITKKTLVVAIIMTISGSLLATPSTQIWIPSTDFQPFGSFRLGIDNYIRANNYNGQHGAAVYDIGPETGFLPFNKIQGEVGFDYLSLGDPVYDNNPLLFNLKVGFPEDSLFKFCPSIVFGGFGFGTKKNLSNYNMYYGMLAKNISFLGRISVGYYMGNKNVLLDENLKTANRGILLSWDRIVKEISDKLWVAVDYQGGRNSFGALNMGVAWSFSKNVSVIFGYDIYNNKKVFYNTTDYNRNSFTTQLDINF